MWRCRILDDQWTGRGGLPTALLLCPDENPNDRLLGHLDYNWTDLAVRINRVSAALRVRQVEAEGNSLGVIIQTWASPEVNVLY